MNILLGCLIVAVGLFLFVSGTTKSEFVVYRLLVARSRILWGERVHGFYQVAGILVAVFGCLCAVTLGSAPAESSTFARPELCLANGDARGTLLLAGSG